MIASAGDVMQMFIRHERNIMRLYEVFAECFPNSKDMWRSFAVDKQRHLKRLEELNTEGSLDEWLKHENRLAPQSMKFAEKYIESQAEKARNGKLGISQACAIAKDIETALVEKQFSGISELPSEELKTALISIAADTKKHLDEVIQAFDAEQVS
jgi:hypothetical protein